MNRTFLSAEALADSHTLILAAIKWYEVDQISKNKRVESLISDRDYSLLVDLRGKLDRGEDIPNSLLNLLKEVLTAYEAYLSEFTEKPWINRTNVGNALERIKKLTTEI